MQGRLQAAAGFVARTLPSRGKRDHEYPTHEDSGRRGWRRHIAWIEATAQASPQGVEMLAFTRRNAACCTDVLNFSPRRFSTIMLPERERVAYWREMFGRQAVHLDIESRSNNPFKAEAVVRGLPGLRSTSFVSAPA